MNIDEILDLEEGPARTAALVAWVQSLYASASETPVLVGGAAVELYTGGAYTTGDLDFVGAVPKRVAASLRGAGFKKHGRHWINEEAEVFLEFPGESLEPGECALTVDFEGESLRIISAEDLLVDRLGAWQYWKSSIDAVNALLLWKAMRSSLDMARLERRVSEAGWTTALDALRDFDRAWPGESPAAGEIELWAKQGP